MAFFEVSVVASPNRYGKTTSKIDLVCFLQVFKIWPSKSSDFSALDRSNGIFHGARSSDRPPILTLR